MRISDGSLNFSIGLDLQQLRQDADRANATLQSISNHAVAEGQRIDNAFAKIATTVGSVFTIQKLGEFISAVTNVRGEYQKLEMSFTTMLGGKSKADALMKQMVDTAAITPFNLTEVAAGAKQLVAYGVSAETVNETLTKLGDISAGLSIPLNDLIYLYGTTRVQGRLFATDVRQFMGRGIPLVQELSKALGKTENEINGMVTAGLIGFPEVEKVINRLTNKGGMFFNMMEGLSKTNPGKLSNLGDKFQGALNDLGKKSEGATSAAIEGAGMLLDNYQEIGKEIAALVAAYGVYKAVLMSISAVNSIENGVLAARYKAELGALNSLLPAKQAAKMSDIDAAVASGRMTTAKAAEVAAIRQEVAAKLDSLKATHAMALSESQAAAITHKAALERALASKSMATQREIELAHARLSGTAAQAEAAQKALIIAQEERHVAVKAKKATADTLAIASGKARTAGLVVETFQQNVNSAAEAAAATKTNFLTIAKTKLIATTRALNATMLANPYVLAAIAIAGLAYAIYKVSTHQTEAEKAQKRLNETVSEFTRQTAAEQAEITRLFDKLRNTKKESENYQKVKDEIISKYGNYLSGLQEEVRNLNNVEAAYRAISTAAKQAAIDRAVTKATQEAQDSYADNVSNLNNNLKSVLESKMSKGAAAAFLETLNLELEKTGKISEESKEKLKQFDHEVRHMETGQVIDKGNTANFVLDQIKNNRKSLDDAYTSIRKSFGVSTNEYEGLAKDQVEAYIKSFENALSSVKSSGTAKVDLFEKTVSFGSAEEIELHIAKLKSVKDSIESVGQAKGSFANVSDEVKSTSKEIVLLNEEIVSLRNGKTIPEAGKSIAEVIESKKKSLEEAEKKLELLTGRSPKSTRGTGSEKNSNTRLYELAKAEQEYADSMKAQARKNAFEIEQARIGGMQDGFQKQSDQIALNYEKMMFENEQRKADMISQLADVEEKRFDKNKPRGSVKMFDRGSVKEDSLTSEQLSQLKSFENAANEYRMQANKETLKTILEDVQTYEQSRFAITEEFENKRKSLKTDSGELRPGVSSQNIDEVNLAETEALAAIDEQFATREASYESWVSYIATMSLDQLRQTLMQAKADLEALEKKGGNGANIAVARSKVTAASKSLTKATEDARLSPDKKEIKQWETLREVIANTEDALTDVEDALGDTGKKIVATAKGIASSAITMIDGIITLAYMSIEGARVTAVGASATIATVEKASVILTIISAAIMIVTQIFSIFSKKKDVVAEFNKELVSLNDELRRTRLEYLLAGEDRESVFGIDSWGKVNDAILVANESLKDYHEARARIADRKVYDYMTDEYAKMNGYETRFKNFSESIRNMKIELQNPTWFRGGKYKDLKDVPGLFGEDGEPVLDALKTFSEGDMFKKLSGANQEMILDMIADYEMYEAALEEVRNYLGDVFGDLGASMTDALVSAFVNGTDAAKDFTNEVSKMIENLAKQMVYAATIAPYAEKAQKELIAIMQKDISDEEKFDLMTGVIAGFTKDVLEGQKIANGLLDEFKQTAKEHGYDIFASETESRKATAKGLEAMTQDSADELNGRFTALQYMTSEIVNNTRELVVSSNMQLRHLAGIEVNTARLEAIEVGIKNINGSLSDIQLKGLRVI